MAAASADRGPFSLQSASHPRRTAADSRSRSMYSLTFRRTSVRLLLAHWSLVKTKLAGEYW
eukprot:8201754-Alexandrium_andersonii.AAC.1